jgi:hypothetical protein
VQANLADPVVAALLLELDAKISKTASNVCVST